MEENKLNDQEELANDSEDESSMPPLEDISDQNENKTKEKKIVIDKEEEKPTDADGWMDILDNGELKKKVLSPGDGQTRPERGSTVVIKLTTKLLDEDKIVESESYEKIDIVVGDYEVVQGLDLAIPLMELGEEALVVVKPRFAYGKLGKPGEIPPETTLSCQVHLQEILWLDEDAEYPIEDRIRIGSRKKDRGNFWYGRGDFSTAIHCYRAAVNFLDAREEEMEQSFGEMKLENEKNDSKQTKDLEPNPKLSQLLELRSATYNNLAAAQMKIEAFDAALKSVDSALLTQPNNVKALFRKGKILGSKREFSKSIEVLNKALTMSDENDTKLIQNELAKYVFKRNKELATEKKLYKRMLQLDKPEKGKKQISSKWWLKWGVVGGVAMATASVLAYKFVVVH